MFLCLLMSLYYCIQITYTCMYVLFVSYTRDRLEVFVSGFMCCTADECDPAVALSWAESSGTNEERQRHRQQTRAFWVNHPDQICKKKGLKKVNWWLLFLSFEAREQDFFILTWTPVTWIGFIWLFWSSLSLQVQFGMCLSNVII